MMIPRIHNILFKKNSLSGQEPATFEDKGMAGANHPHLVAHFARHLVGKIWEHDCHCSFAHH